jgi:hypothetical protein
MLLPEMIVFSFYRQLCYTWEVQVYNFSKKGVVVNGEAYFDQCQLVKVV